MVDTPRRYDSSGTREHLLESAAALFKIEGYESSSVRKVADGAQVTIGAFYGHFASKRAVLYEVVSRAFLDPGSTITAFTNDAARSLVLTVASFAHTDPAAAAVLTQVMRACTLASGETEAATARMFLVSAVTSDN